MGDDLGRWSVYCGGPGSCEPKFGLGNGRDGTRRKLTGSTADIYGTFESTAIEGMILEDDIDDTRRV